MGELCPVYFYMPDTYLDSWERELLQLALASFTADIKEEIQNILDRIAALGGGTWRQLLAKFLKEGTTGVWLCQQLLETLHDPAEKRAIFNRFSGGLFDSYDALLPEIEILQAEVADKKRREMDVD